MVSPDAFSVLGTPLALLGRKEGCDGICPLLSLQSVWGDKSDFKYKSVRYH